MKSVRHRAPFGRQARIGVQQQQPVAGRRRDARRELRAAPPRGVEHLGPSSRRSAIVRRRCRHPPPRPRRPARPGRASVAGRVVAAFRVGMTAEQHVLFMFLTAGREIATLAQERRENGGHAAPWRTRLHPGWTENSPARPIRRRWPSPTAPRRCPRRRSYCRREDATAAAPRSIPPAASTTRRQRRSTTAGRRWLPTSPTCRRCRPP